MKRLKVLVVDASVLYRKMLETAIVSVFPKAVVHCVVTSAEATERLAGGNYQMALLDTGVDEGDVLRLVSFIRGQYPHIHLILMGRGTRTDEAIMKAAGDMGARAYMAKPIHENYERNAQAIQRYFSRLFQELSDEEEVTAQPAKAAKPSPLSSHSVNMIVLAASTGGPTAIETLLTGIGDPLCPPILVVQHMPAAFTHSLAESLGLKCRLTVKEAEEGERPLPGHVYIAPGGKHMVIKQNRCIGLTQQPFVNGVRPSADVLLSSVAEVHRGETIVAIILTGMGKDAANGVQKLKAQCNCHCIVQSKETCIVYGMPREVAERGLADQIEDLDVIGNILQKIASEGVVHHEHRPVRK